MKSVKAAPKATPQQINRLHYEGLIQAILNQQIPDDIYVKIDEVRHYGKSARSYLPYLFAYHVIPGVLKKYWEETYMFPLFKSHLLKLYARTGQSYTVTTHAEDYDELLGRIISLEADYLINACFKIRESSEAYASFRDKVKEISAEPRLFEMTMPVEKPNLINRFLIKVKGTQK